MVVVSKRKSKSNSSNNNNDIKPVLFTLDRQYSAVEDYFTRAPEQTRWTQNILNQLKGASSSTSGYALDYLDKIDPVSEQQLKRIFPKASPVQMEDPLSIVTKTRLHDNIRRDPSTQRGLFFIVFFLLGKEVTPTFEVARKFATKERAERELKAIQNNEQYLQILEEIMNRDDDVQLQTRLAELVFSAEAFGRSAQIKKYDRKGFPCKLIPLASTRLSRVWVDRKSWDFLGVEYLDYPTNQNILLAQDVLHMEANDFHITPNSRYFGIPSIESTMAIAERNRKANETAIPEIMSKMWAGNNIYKILGAHSEQKIREIQGKVAPGKDLYLNEMVEVTQVQLNHDLDKMVNAVMEGNKDIYRGLTIPLVVAFQDEQNRSTAEHSMIQWYESVLEFKRNQINHVLWHQWYKPQLEKIFEGLDMTRAAESGSVLQYLETRAETMKELEDRNEQYHQPIPFKIKLEFSNIRTTGFLDTASALMQMGDRGYLEPYMVREEAGLGRWNNEMKEVEFQNAKFVESQFGVNVNRLGTNMNPFNPQNLMQNNKQNLQNENEEEEQEEEQSSRTNFSSNAKNKKTKKGFGNMRGGRLPTRSSSE